MSEHIPSPADARPTAAEFLAAIDEQGGRIYRMVAPPRVFVLTNDGSLAKWIERQGGRPFMPAHLRPEHPLPRNSYERVKGGIEEWDIEIAMVPVEGDETIWEAAATYRKTPEGFDMNDPADREDAYRQLVDE